VAADASPPTGSTFCGYREAPKLSVSLVGCGRDVHGRVHDALRTIESGRNQSLIKFEDPPAHRSRRSL